MTMLLVEQSVPRATSIADRLCLLRIGRSVMDVDARDPAAVETLMGTAFGGEEDAAPSRTSSPTAAGRHTTITSLTDGPP